jgi:phosphatidate cytidylyltransferase
VASAVVLIPAFVWVTAGAPARLFAILVIGLSAAATWELTGLFARAGRGTSPWLAAGAAGAVTAGFLAPPILMPVMALVVMAILSAPLLRRSAPSVEPAATALLAVTYVGWLMGHALLLHDLAGGPMLVLFLAGVTWCGESAAYLVGSLAGRRRLAPAISPGKTVEGAVAQAVVSGAAGLLLGLWFVPSWSLATAGAAGLLLGVLGQIGDLAESVIKRSLGAKDAGHIIPGHGGLLDRLDGLLFNTPALYYYVVALGARPAGTG